MIYSRKIVVITSSRSQKVLSRGRSCHGPFIFSSSFSCSPSSSFSSSPTPSSFQLLLPPWWCDRRGIMFSFGYRDLMGNSVKVTKEQALVGRGEAMKVTNEHYITKNPIKPPFPSGIQVAAFGTGCFWGAEKGFWRLPGVYSTAVGYCGGYTPNPTYQECCTGETGHNEGVLVAYDASKISYVDLLKQFWECHDPTQGNGQGGDRGTQYRSGIYCYTQDQYTLAQESKTAYQKVLSEANFPPITTEIIINQELPFYYAEDYHQQYLAKPGGRKYCSAEPTGISVPNFETWVPENLKETHKPFLDNNYWAKYGPKPGCTINCPDEQIVL